MNLTESVETQNQREIVADKILIIHNNTPALLIANLLACLPLTFVLLDKVSPYILGSWVFSIYALSFIRWLHYRAFKRANPTLNTHLSETPSHYTNEQLKNIKKLERSYTLLAFLSGCIWGSAGYLFFDSLGNEGFTVLALTLLSMIGGSMSSLSYRPLMYAAFAIPTLAPMNLMMFFHDLAYYNWLAVGLSLFTGFTFIFSNNLHQVIHRSLVLKYKNADLVVSLKKQTEAANNANKEKSRFIAAASHDLRQPLHAANLFVESLQSKITQKEQQHDLNRINRGLDSLGELLNTLLNISQLDAGVTAVNNTVFSIDDVLKKLHDQYVLNAEAKKLQFTFKNCLHNVHSDPILIEQILGNLISNAIRYTEKGRVEIFCTSHPLKQSVKKIHVHIKDTGIGISQQDGGNIFNEFFQLDNPERDRSKGLGLGLAIVRRTAQLLKHPLHFSSNIGKGTEFILELPVGKAISPELSAPIKPSIENMLHKRKILVIDNEIDILDGMRNLLETWGCDVSCVESTELALKKLNEGYLPQFILADYRMPGNLNGCDIVTAIRQKNTSIPALIITGDTGTDVIKEIKSKNLIALNKPIKPAQLRIAMTRLISEFK